MHPTEIQLAEIAGWRALLTEAQHAARAYLPPGVEGYVVRLLYRTIGRPDANLADDAGDFIERFATLASRAEHDAVTVGDQSLVFAGLFPEQAIRKGIPLAYFVQVGIHAYRDYAAASVDSGVRASYIALADHFVAALDVLHTLRERQQNAPCIDALNAHQLWAEVGSSHAWQVLRRLTNGLPGRCPPHFLRH
jgi:hypothetical protein